MLPEPVSPFVKKLAAEGALATAKSLREFKPRRVHHVMLGVLVAGFSPLNVLDFAAAMGYPERVVRKVLRDPAAINWVMGRATQQCKIGLVAVYGRLMQESLKSRSPKWAEMFLKKFDPEYAQREQIGQQTNNTQVNIYRSWSNEELQAFVRDKQQKVLGQVVSEQ